MPITKSAQKKMRQDKRRALRNLRAKRVYKGAIKVARKSPGEKKIGKAYSALDKAVKKGVIKKSKASRLKSRVSKLMKKK